MTAVTKLEIARALLVEYSKFSKEELAQWAKYANVPGMKADAKKKAVMADMDTMGIYVRDAEGNNVKKNYWTKTQIVEAIWTETEPYRAKELISVDTTPEMRKALLGEADKLVEVQKQRPELADVALQLYKNIRDYANSLWDAKQQAYIAYTPEIYIFPNRIVATLREFTNSKGEVVSAATIKKTYAPIIKGFVRENIEKFEKNNPHYKQMIEVMNTVLGHQYQEYSGSRKYKPGIIDAILTPERIEVNEQDREHRTINKEEPSQINVKVLVDHANKVLTELKDTDSKTKWKDVALALMVVTGRRSSEIMSSAKFELINKANWVSFYGQLKTKGRADFEGAYEIPLLAPADKVCYALQWLESKGKRTLPESNDSKAIEVAAKKCNKIYSKELNECAKEWDNYLEYVKRGVVNTKKGEEGEVKDSKLTCKACREIYLIVASQVFNNGEQPSLLVSRYAGHRDNDHATFDRYMTHYRVLDANRIKA